MVRLKSISVFFPAYNNADILPTLIIRAFQTLAEVAEEYEVIVINNGSTDDTGRMLDEMAQYYPRLRVIHRRQPGGYGAVLRAGFATAQKEWIFYTNGEAQYNVRQLALLTQAVKEGVDMVQGYNLWQRDQFHYLLVNLAYRYFVKLFFGLTIRDVDCDFRLMRRDIFGRVKLESITGAITFEMMREIQEAGFRIVEVPVHLWYRQPGQSEFLNFPRVIGVLIALVGWWWRLMVKKEH